MKNTVGHVVIWWEDVPSFRGGKKEHVKREKRFLATEHGGMDGAFYEACKYAGYLLEDSHISATVEALVMSV